MAQTEEAPVNINDERAIRRSRRETLLAQGVNPYPIDSHVTAHTAKLEEKYKDLQDSESTEDVYTVAGRIRALRKHGKLNFIVVEDVEGQIQLFCNAAVLDEATLAILPQFDLGDIVEATGTVLRTKRGQLSIAPTTIRILAKSLRPLPEKYHGLSDRELRYRQRYLDLIMNEDARETFRRRSAIVSLIRRYMEADGYMEVETPMMHAIMGGANAKPFVTHFNALGRDFFLRIATELPLKRLIVGGMERVFEVGRQFRNEGMDLTHNPEFTTMEAYCAYSDLAGMKQLTEGLFKTIAQEICGCKPGEEKIVYQGQEVDFSGTWRSVTVAEVASQVCGEEITIDTPIEHLRELNEKHGIEWQPSWGAGKLLFSLYDELGEETLVNPTFVCDYPQEVSPLAKRKADDPRLTDRFELVICGHEYANAFSELNDPVDQAGRFAEQVASKGLGDDEAMGYDFDYVRALEYGMPPAGGIGYGIDRMVMLFCDKPAIRDVLLFPQMKPEIITREDIASQLPTTTDNTSASADTLLSDSETGASQERAQEVEEASEVEASSESRSDLQMRVFAAAPEQGKSYVSGLSDEAALDLLKQYNDDPYHIEHGQTLQRLMRYFAKEFDPENEEFWGQVGLLHDLDWEKWNDDQIHTIKTAELLDEAGAIPELAHAIQTHNYDMNPALPAPDHKMERVLYAIDELSGLINAYVRMRPSGSVQDFELKSLKKKFKNKKFAAGCNRDVIAHGAELMDMELDELFELVIKATQITDPDREAWLKENGQA